MTSQRLIQISAVALALAGISDLFSIAIAEILLGISIAAFLAAIVAGELRFELPSFRIPLLLYMLWTVLAMVAAPPMARHLPQMYKMWLLAILPVGYGVLRNISVRGSAWFVRALVAVAALSSAWGMVQFARDYYHWLALNKDFYANYQMDRITGFKHHWMTFSGQLMMILMLLVAWLIVDRAGEARSAGVSSAGTSLTGAASAGTSLTGTSLTGTSLTGTSLTGAGQRRGAEFLLALAAAALICAGLLLSFTRGAWLGSAAGVIYLLWMHRRKWLIALPIIALLGYAVAPAFLQHRVRAIVSNANDHSAGARRLMYRAGWSMIKAHPMFGIGPEGVKDEFDNYRPDTYKPDAWYGHLHSDYLQTAASRGVPALLFLLWFFALIWFDMHRLGSRSWLARGAAAASIAYYVEGAVEYNFGGSEVLMMWLFLLVWGYSRRDLC